MRSPAPQNLIFIVSNFAIACNAGLFNDLNVKANWLVCQYTAPRSTT